MKKGTVFAAVAILCISMLPCCSERGEQSALYILEELQAASNVRDPEKKIERLELFVTNHGTHPYRLKGYKEILGVLAVELGDVHRAEQYLNGILEKETDPKVRGMLWVDAFEYYLENSRERALEIAQRLLEGDEKYYRMFLYLGYYLMGGEGQVELAERAMRKAADLATHSVERSMALSILGTLLEKQGRTDEALEVLGQAKDDDFANRALGEILWERGFREEALDAYVRFVSGVPGARKTIKLDSLYTLVHSGTKDLDGKIMAARIRDEGKVPAQTFVDLDGRNYDITGFRGRYLVVNAWSPT